MDPVVLITRALMAGASSVATGALEAGGANLYRGLKARLRSLFHGKPEAETALTQFEQKPDVWQAPLQDAILETDAAEDDEVVRLAGALLALIEQGTGSSTALNTGRGAIAQGPGAVAAGAGGVAIGGDVSDSVIVTGDGNRIDAGDRDS